MKNIFLSLFLFLFIYAFFCTKVFAQEPKVIYISKLNLYLPIQTSPIVKGEWQINDEKTAFFGDRSSLPGTNGTTVVFAHAKNGLFAHLALLKKNDTITLVNKSSVFVYKVQNYRLLYPQDLSFIQTHQKNELAIFTCFGSNDTKRIVYFADLVKIADFPKVHPIVYEL